MATAILNWSLLCEHGTAEALTCNATVNESIERSYICYIY